MLKISANGKSSIQSVNKEEEVSKAGSDDEPDSVTFGTFKTNYKKMEQEHPKTHSFTILIVNNTYFANNASIQAVIQINFHITKTRNKIETHLQILVRNLFKTFCCKSRVSWSLVKVRR